MEYLRRKKIIKLMAVLHGDAVSKFNSYSGPDDNESWYYYGIYRALRYLGNLFEKRTMKAKDIEKILKTPIDANADPLEKGFPILITFWHDTYENGSCLMQPVFTNNPQIRASRIRRCVAGIKYAQDKTLAIYKEVYCKSIFELLMGYARGNREKRDID